MAGAPLFVPSSAMLLVAATRFYSASVIVRLTKLVCHREPPSSLPLEVLGSVAKTFEVILPLPTTVSVGEVSSNEKRKGTPQHGMLHAFSPIPYL